MNDNYIFTLDKEIYIPESNRWTGGRDDTIFCREYDLDEREATLIGTDKGHDVIIVSRDNIVGIVHNDTEDE